MLCIFFPFLFVFGLIAFCILMALLIVSPLYLFEWLDSLQKKSN